MAVRRTGSPSRGRPARGGAGTGRPWAVRLALLAVVTALAAVALPAGAGATAEYRFTISGRGWGHGIGMCQWGAYGYALHGWQYRDILRHYYSGISFVQSDNVTMRVRLRSGLASVRVTCVNDFTASGGGTTVTIPAGTEAVATYAGGAYTVAAGGETTQFAAPVTFAPTRGVLTLLSPTDYDRDGGRFRGTLRVLASDGRLMVVNRVPLESYLRGVVPREVSPSWPREALRAQACAARAYALTSRQPSKDWDVYCDVRDQVYAGVDAEDPRSDAAVRDTRGVTPAYAGAPITAFFFSSSGGHTENIEYAWAGASPVPYLKGVEDPYDTYATYHTWGPLTRSAASVGSALGVSGRVRAVVPVQRGVSPRIVRAAVVTSDGVTFVSGSTLRVKLDLYSTWATLRSMSINPCAADKVTVAAGTPVLLKGRIYPAIRAGATVSLERYVDGAWKRVRAVATTRGSEPLPDGSRAAFSVYRVTVRPGQTATYRFTRGTASSPATTITVQP